MFVCKNEKKRVHEQQVNICEIDSIINILWLPKQKFKSIVFIKIRERVHTNKINICEYDSTFYKNLTVANTIIQEHNSRTRTW